MHKYSVRALKWIIFLSIAFFVGMYVGSSGTSLAQGSRSEEREIGSGYQFVSPLLSCEERIEASASNEQIHMIESALEEQISKNKRAGNIVEAAIYFRELANGGAWMGIREDAHFAPRSLLKVPLAISVYKLSEKAPNLLEQVVEFGGGDLRDEKHYPPLEEVKKDASYNVRELARRSLVFSDNYAAALLAQVIGDSELERSYSHLGVEEPRDDYYTVSVKNYASFFRILYNASYLSDAHSNELLEVLSRTQFDKGINLGVPIGTLVSHKFGERLGVSGGNNQLHDCGIIYAKEKPYILCVMTEGKDFTKLESFIQAASKIVYDQYVR